MCSLHAVCLISSHFLADTTTKKLETSDFLLTHFSSKIINSYHNFGSVRSLLDLFVSKKAKWKLSETQWRHYIFDFCLAGVRFLELSGLLFFVILTVNGC